MRPGAFKWLTTAIAIIVFDGCALAQETDVGKAEYLSSCAPCHGSDAKGNGPVAVALKQHPTDLTVLAKNNKGVFPVDRAYRVIDGREEISGHGTREMPIWGYRFVPPSSKNLKMVDEYIVAPPGSADAIVHSRILALIDYLSRVQEK